MSDDIVEDIGILLEAATPGTWIWNVDEDGETRSLRALRDTDPKTGERKHAGGFRVVMVPDAPEEDLDDIGRLAIDIAPGDRLLIVSAPAVLARARTAIVEANAALAAMTAERDAWQKAFGDALAAVMSVERPRRSIAIADGDPCPHCGGDTMRMGRAGLACTVCEADRLDADDSTTVTYIVPQSDGTETRYVVPRGTKTQRPGS